MATLSVSHDTSDFEVAAVLDETGQLTDVCASKAYRLLDRPGFVILTGLLSAREAKEFRDRVFSRRYGMADASSPLRSSR